jgi:hypothetical protein
MTSLIFDFDYSFVFEPITFDQIDVTLKSPKNFISQRIFLLIEN